jgi:hypothetical protein
LYQLTAIWKGGILPLAKTVRKVNESDKKISDENPEYTQKLLLASGALPVFDSNPKTLYSCREIWFLRV